MSSMQTPLNQLALATSALRDLAMGFPGDEIAASSGAGLECLLRELVAYQRNLGIDDEGWDCPATEDIPVNRLPAFEPFRLIVDAHNNSGLAYAVATIDRDWLMQVARLRRLAQEHGLIFLASRWPAIHWRTVDHSYWEGERNRALVQAHGGRIKVADDGGFWIEAWSLVSGFELETVMLDIDALMKAAVGPRQSQSAADVGPGLFWYQGDLFRAEELENAELIELFEEFPPQTEAGQ